MSNACMMYRVRKITVHLDDEGSSFSVPYEREIIGYYDKAKDAVKAVERITGERICYRRMHDFLEEFKAINGRKAEGKELIDLALAQRRNNSTEFRWNADFSQKTKYEITTELFYWGP